MATYKNTNNCLLFFSANFFLDSINTIFQFRFVETKDNKWVLEFRPINDVIWQRKPISICLTTNHIEIDSTHNTYQITPSELNIEEDVQILKTYYTLHQLLVEALNKPDLILPLHFISVTQIKLFAPYHFDHSTFGNWLQQPGQTTIRISNAAYKNNYANINLAFNNWKYYKLFQRETPIKKRKLDLEDTPEPVPENIIVCAVCQPTENN
jgi:hypothetical protein